MRPWEAKKLRAANPYEKACRAVDVVIALENIQFNRFPKRGLKGVPPTPYTVQPTRQLDKKAA